MSLTSVHPAVRVSDLVKRFPHTTAFSGISFELRGGGVLGLVTPTSGSLRLLGADPFADRETALRQVGFNSPEAHTDAPSASGGS